MIGGYGDPEAKRTLPFDHRTASSYSSSQSEDGLDSGNIIGRGLSEDISLTIDSLNAFFGETQKSVSTRLGVTLIYLLCTEAHQRCRFYILDDILQRLHRRSCIIPPRED